MHTIYIHLPEIILKAHVSVELGRLNGEVGKTGVTGLDYPYHIRDIILTTRLTRVRGDAVDSRSIRSADAPSYISCVPS
jgi:hypothetical protein